MATLLEEFVRQSIDELLLKLPPEKCLEGLSPQERLLGLNAEEVARALPPEIREALARQPKTNGRCPSPSEWSSLCGRIHKPNQVKIPLFRYSSSENRNGPV